jgi:hypothetical protein
MAIKPIARPAPLQEEKFYDFGQKAERPLLPAATPLFLTAYGS